MGKRKNFTIQLNMRIDNLLALGERKVEARKTYREECEAKGEYWCPSKSNLIHSANTASTYRQTIGEACSWLKENRTEIWSSKDLNKFDATIAYEYLHAREDAGCSPWTVCKDMSALNKVLNLGLNQKDGDLKSKNYNDVTRSRLPREMDLKYDPNKYKNQIEFAHAFGVRRESILGGNYAVKESSLFQRDGRVYCSVIEKGGKYRETPCLEKYQNLILEKYDVQERESFVKYSFTQTFTDANKTEIVHPQSVDKQGFKTFYSNSKDEPIFDKYSTNIDNHAFRGQYARDLYKELCEAKGEIKNDYKGEYDRELVRKVSNALGHERLGVVINSYFK